MSGTNIYATDEDTEIRLVFILRFDVSVTLVSCVYNARKYFYLCVSLFV